MSITTTGSGNWSSTTPNAPWPSGTVPAATDDVIIAKNHTVTLDVMTAVANSVTLNVGTTGADVGGMLTCVTNASTNLTVQQGISASGATGGGGTYSASILLDMSAAPTHNCEILLNNVKATGSAYGLTIGGNFTIKGASRKRQTYTSAALVANTTMSVDVLDATGWRVGDVLVFATTQAYNATPRTDLVTIATITPTTGTAATITWTDGAGTGGAVLYDHQTACLVGNFTSNMILRPGTDGDRGWVNIANANLTLSAAGTINNCQFKSFGSTATYGALTTNFNINLATAISFNDNAFYDNRGPGIYFSSDSIFTTKERNIFYTTANTDWAIRGSTAAHNTSLPITDTAVFRGGTGISAVFPGSTPLRALVSGLTASSGITGQSAITATRSPATFVGCEVWACNGAVAAVGEYEFYNCTFGTKYGATNSYMFWPGYSKVRAVDCMFQTGVVAATATSTIDFDIQLENKNADPAVQEVYQKHSGTVPVIQRDVAIMSRSTSSMKFTCNAATALTRSLQVLAKAGETITMLVLVRKNSTYGASTLPSVTVSGLGITPVVVAMSAGTAADTWETLNVQATNTGVTDGLLTVTLTAQSANAGAIAYFSGLPFAPFVSRCRHYGYLFDETNPTRTVNATISANEATAAAYTGMTVTWGATSSVALTASKTFQQLYDYTQAQACLNVGYALPLTGTGIAGSPALSALGAVTINTGYTLNGSGSLSMGANTLTTEFTGAVPYTYTGGTWSQLSTVPAFSGGQLNIGALGTYTFTMTSAIISMTPGSAGTYTMSGGTFAGTIDLRNTTAYAITVRLPSGTTTTTANNTGGTITVDTSTVVTVGVTVTAASTGSPIQNARVYLIAAAGGPLSVGTVILSGLTDASGVYQDAAFVYSSTQPVSGHVRKATGSPLYKAVDLSGSINAGGYSAAVLMIGDE